MPIPTQPKWSIRELHKRRAAHAVAVMEKRVDKIEQELKRIEQASKDKEGFTQYVREGKRLY